MYIKFISFIIIFISILDNQSKAMTSSIGDRLKFNIGTDIYYLSYNNSSLEYNDADIITKPYNHFKRISIGISYKLFDEYPIYIGFRTNRLVNFPIERDAYSKTLNQNVNVKTQIITDSFFIGYAYNRFLPFFFISNSEINTQVILRSGQSIRKNKITALFGIGCSYSINKNISTSIVYIFPNNNIDLKSGIGLSLNFSF